MPLLLRLSLLPPLLLLRLSVDVPVAPVAVAATATPATAVPATATAANCISVCSHCSMLFSLVFLHESYIWITAFRLGTHLLVPS